MNKTTIINILSGYLPEDSVKFLADKIIEHKVRFVVSKSRSTKFGDYKYNRLSKEHRISVNGNLNPYSFLITAIHEFAHLEAFKNHGFRIKSHGNEWKASMITLMSDNLKYFPQDIQLALKRYLKNPKASSCSDSALYRVLRRYDKKESVWLEDLSAQSEFKIRGKVFCVEEKRRTRFLCREKNTGKKYLIHGQAEVLPIETEIKEFP